MTDEPRIELEIRIDPESSWISADPSILGLLVYEGPFESKDTSQVIRDKIKQLISKYANPTEAEELLALIEGR